MLVNCLTRQELRNKDVRVATDEKNGSWAASGGLVKKILHLADAGIIRAAWEKVGGETSIVVDTFNGDVGGTECALESLAGWWTDGASLLQVSQCQKQDV